MLTFEDPSIEVMMEDLETNLGPMVLAKALLEPQGQWPAVQSDLREVFARFNLAGDGSVRADGEYLLTTVTVR